MERFKFIGGPCVIENRDHTLFLAEEILKATKDMDIDLYFKASFDKANRTDSAAYRGPGIDKGLEILRSVKEELGLKIVSDIHNVQEAAQAAEVLDVIQIPAFLCRQTDLIKAGAETGKILNIKKGQFLSPEDARFIVKKARDFNAVDIWLTERGSTWGYGDLIVDMTAIPVMRSYKVPVIIDATHSVQQPGKGYGKTGGRREMVPTIALAAIAAGADGLFLEIHDEPEKSPSDAGNIYPVSQLRVLLKKVLDIYEILG
ncbi:3-deoxy-8-phosphooctulonate synthase [bacterium]|nr:3-deoxy-8-phosphooctulonate synthase [bacterium]